MEGKINQYGNLEIKRNGKLIVQWCFFNHRDGGHHCGDWCPQFGEPDSYRGSEEAPNPALLNICQGRLLNFDKFIDERGEDE